ncbi:MAG: MATE family efflux transporter [Pikeienuella sp.]
MSAAGRAAEGRRAARTRLLLEGPIGPTLARLAAPNVLAMFVTSAQSIAEGYFAGRLGVAALAAMALVFPLVMLTQMLSAGAMGGAISSAVARALGAGDPVRAARLTLASWVIALAAAALSAALMALFGAAIFRLLGGGEEAARRALDYAAVFFPGCVALWLLNSTLSVIRGTGNMAAPSTLLFIMSLAAIPLSGAFALGWGPFPAMGTQGLALGLILANGIGAAIAMIYVLSGRVGLSFAGVGLPARSLYADILRVGLIAGLNAFQTVLTIVLMVGLVGRYGEAALAGYGLGARLEFLLIPIVFGIGAAMTAMVGANIGAGARPRALRVAWTGSFAAAGIVGAIGAVAAIRPDLWLGLFLDPADIGPLEAGRAYFRAVAPFYACFGLGLALYFASQGAGRMVWPVVGSLFRMATAFGGALLLTAWTDLGVTGVFAGIAAGMFAYGVVTALAIWRTAWR